MRADPFHRAPGEGPIQRHQRHLRWALGGALLLLCAYLAWPWLTLWRLDRALIRDDRVALAALIDLDAVRDGLRRQLNKEADATRHPPSDAFIEWLEQAIHRGGTAALEREVDVDWVRVRLLAHSPPGTALVPALTWAFFDDPFQVSLSLGPPGQAPVQVGLGLTWRGWRVTTLYY